MLSERGVGWPFKPLHRDRSWFPGALAHGPSLELTAFQEFTYPWSRSSLFKVSGTAILKNATDIRGSGKAQEAIPRPSMSSNPEGLKKVAKKICVHGTFKCRAASIPDRRGRQPIFGSRRLGKESLHGAPSICRPKSPETWFDDEGPSPTGMAISRPLRMWSMTLPCARTETWFQLPFLTKVPNSARGVACSAL
jgi:hypothetical protein